MEASVIWLLIVVVAVTVLVSLYLYREKSQWEAWYWEVKETEEDTQALRRQLEDERAGRLAAQEAYTGIVAQQQNLLDRYAELANRPPHQIDPTPVIHALREVFVPAQWQETGESTEHQATYDKVSPEHTKDVADRVFLPDVEFDEWLSTQPGFPTRGGWINRETNSAQTPGQNQTPVHAITQDGRLIRQDGQPMFRPGDGQTSTPPGGTED